MFELQKERLVEVFEHLQYYEYYDAAKPVDFVVLVVNSIEPGNFIRKRTFY